MEKKKNPNSVTNEDYIIPASFFKSENFRKGTTNSTKANHDTLVTTNELPKIVDEKIDATAPVSNTPEGITAVDHSETYPSQENLSEQKVEEATPDGLEEEKKPVAKLSINTPKNRVSGLSLSSLRVKKEHQLNRKETVIDESKLPRSPFSEEDMQKHWADFVHKIDIDGRKILASNLNSDTPKLRDNFTIWIELPNSTMKKEIEREQFDLMEYLRLKLNNHFVKLQITVNETTSTKFAFTPEEKYEKLRAKNPAIDLLRREFDLDL